MGSIPAGSEIFFREFHHVHNIYLIKTKQRFKIKNFQSLKLEDEAKKNDLLKIDCHGDVIINEHQATTLNYSQIFVFKKSPTFMAFTQILIQA